MKNEYKNIILLLKSAITGEKYSLGEDFKLENIMKLIEKHSVSPLIYLGALNCGISVSHPSMQQLFQRYGQSILLHEKQMYDIKRIYQAFEENGIDYMPVKGYNMKSLYPSAEIRMMGDIDILIKIEQYPEIEKIMKNLNFEFQKEGDHDYTWNSSKLNVELHYLLLEECTEAYKDYLGDGWKLAKYNDQHRFYMSREDEFIYLFIHFAKHYRIAGIGCRHVLDLWVFLRSYSDLDFCYIEEIMKKLSIYKFYCNTINMINVWFNNEKSNDISELMTRFIFESGSWGTAKSAAMSRGVKAAQQNHSISGGRFMVVLKAVFPPLEDLRHRYHILKDRSYLLPFIWIWRWIDALINRRENVKSYKDTVEIVLKKDFSEYEKDLSAVGLNFTFTESEDKNESI